MSFQLQSRGLGGKSQPYSREEAELGLAEPVFPISLDLACPIFWDVGIKYVHVFMHA